MQLPIYKYHGAGNDFIVVDSLTQAPPPLSDAAVGALCDRHTGVGADGLLVLAPHPSYAFALRYHNADGRPGSLCGNGARCAVALAHRLGRFGTSNTFTAYDGPHRAVVHSPTDVEVEMHAPAKVTTTPEGYFLDTGSPHLVIEVGAGLPDYPVASEGVILRYDARFGPGGANVNYVQPLGPGRFAIRTYERGVEAETLACGTGIAAAGWAQAQKQGLVPPWALTFDALGGTLVLRYTGSELWLRGPVAAVFTAQVEVQA